MAHLLFPPTSFPHPVILSDFKEFDKEVIDGLRHLDATLEQYLKREIQASTQLPPGFHILEYFGKVSAKFQTLKSRCNDLVMFKHPDYSVPTS